MKVGEKINPFQTSHKYLENEKKVILSKSASCDLEPFLEAVPFI